jgi:hypothetical protein
MPAARMSHLGCELIALKGLWQSLTWVSFKKTDKEVPFPGRVPIDFARRIVLPSCALPKTICKEGLKMKFTGLILICASSSLALILPAFGVVQFPKVPVAAKFPSGSAVSTNAGLTPASSFPNAFQGGNAHGTILPESLSESLSETLPGANLPPRESPFPPSLFGSSESQVANNSNRTFSKFGMGAWLLLGPACLVGLGMWSFSRNPSSSKLSKNAN